MKKLNKISQAVAAAGVFAASASHAAAAVVSTAPQLASQAVSSASTVAGYVGSVALNAVTAAHEYVADQVNNDNVNGSVSGNVNNATTASGYTGSTQSVGETIGAVAALAGVIVVSCLVCRCLIKQCCKNSVSAENPSSCLDSCEYVAPKHVAVPTRAEIARMEGLPTHLVNSSIVNSYMHY